MNYNTIPFNLTTDTEQLVFTATSDVVILGLQVANTHATDQLEFDAFIRRGLTDAYIAKGFQVGTNEARTPIDQKAKIILVEGDQLYAKINSGQTASVVVSYAAMGNTGGGGMLPIQEGDAGKVMVVKNTEDGYKLVKVSDVFLTISPTDAGKVVVVNEAGTGYEVEALILPQPLPEITLADEGKSIRVVMGEAVWADVPVASSTTLGGIKVGSGLLINDGVLSIEGIGGIPVASADTLGVIKVGSGLQIDSGVLSVISGGMPIATTETLGAIKVGPNLSITAEGVLSSTLYSLPAATSGTRGGIRVGSNLKVREGSTDIIDVTIPTASSSIVGGIKVGDGLSIADGVLSVTTVAPIDLVPTGAVMAFAGGSAPTGWLICNGAAISREVYSNLFAAIGATYGAGNGLTTFNLPDLRGEFVRGLDAGRGVDAGRVLGSSQASANLSHSHSGSSNETGAHTHSYTDTQVTPGESGTMPSDEGDWVKYSVASTTGSSGNHSHIITISNSGATEARPRNIAMNYIIKT